MATEEQKNARLLRIMNVAVYGLIEGLWDLFGESSFATVHSISTKILDMMEKEAGVQIAGENLEELTVGILRLLTGEFSAMSAGKSIIEGNNVSLVCQDCFLHPATNWLESDGVQPFACIPMNVTATAIRQRLGTRHRVLGREWDPDSKTCTIHFEMV